MHAFWMAMLLAFSSVESSNVDRKPYWDGKEQAWGYYAFHRARWVEFGGDPAKWGNATRLEQDKVMLQALRRYVANCPPDANLIVWIGNYHNIGHGSRKQTAYTIKLARELSKLKIKDK